MKSNYSIRYQTTRRLTLLSASANLFLAIFKLIVGFFSHSQALIADGFHSLSDILSDGLVLMAASMGKQIPDKEHPYGHQRIETIAAISLALLMFATGGTILYTNIRHLWLGDYPSLHSLPVIFTALLSIMIYCSLFYLNYQAGKRLHSNLLISNSYHNRSDAYTSGIVMLSGIGALLHIHHIDVIGAIIISILIIKMGSSIFWNGLQELIDAGVDEDTLQKMLACTQQVPGVTSIHQFRTRLHGGTIFVDVHVIVDPFISVSEGHHISERVHLKLMQTFPKVLDVVVHIDPEDDEKNRPCLHLPSREQFLQQFNQIAKDFPYYSQIQKIYIHYYDGQIYLEIILPYIKDQNQLPSISQQYQNIQSKIKDVANIKVYFCSFSLDDPKLNEDEFFCSRSVVII